MGIAYPHEIETRELSRASFMHTPFDLIANVQRFVYAGDGGVYIAGRYLSVAARDPERVAGEMRSLLISRLRERRPDADRHTWARLTRIVHGVVPEGGAVDTDLRRALIETIDGL